MIEERTVPVYVRMALDALWAAGHEAYPVGGCVRDILMGKEPADWDICTSALPEQTEEVFADRRVIETGMRHGTITVLCEGHPLEITTFRTESGYQDGRHPDSVTFVQDLQADLARRDFTVNAMALDRDGSVIDPFGGQVDLAAGIIRCVGAPSRRFGEDALRILRALRFAARLGFTVCPETAAAIHEERMLLERISPERIFSELQGLLVGDHAGDVLRAFPDVIFVFIPELEPELGFDQHNPNHIHDIWTHTTMAVDAIGNDPVLRLTMLLHDVGKAEMYFTDDAGVGHFYGHAEAGAVRADTILRRLRCDNATRTEVVELITYHDIDPPKTVRSVRRLMVKLGLERLRRVILCWKADSADRAEDIRTRNLGEIALTEAALEEILASEHCFRLRDMAVDGKDVMALGIPEGPAVGRVLQELFRQVTEEGVPNERDRLLALAKKLTNGQ